MGTITTNGYFYKPDVGETGFKAAFDSAVNSTDTQIKTNKDHKTAQDSISGLLKCDGSGNYTSAAEPYLVRGSASLQTLGSTYADVVGSSVTYTPKLGSSKVLYAFTCQMHRPSTAVGYAWFRLFNNGSEVTNARRSVSVPGNYDFLFTYFHVMDSWAGTHTVKLQAMSGSAYTVTLNTTGYMDGTTGVANVYNNVAMLEF